MKKEMTVAKAIVECLKLQGIDKVFSVPGESFLPLIDAFYDEPAIDFISTRHEGGASFMAEGYAKASLKPGVVMATRGVGAANLSIGIHTAYQDSTPMIIFLGQVHRKFLGREGFQEVVLDQWLAPITKWAVELRDAERTPEIIQRAIRTAISGRPGPVVISLPEDILIETAEMVFGPPPKRPKPSISLSDIHQFEQILSKSKRPVIIAGGGIKWSESEDKLQSFAEKYSLPVITAFRRHDVFLNNHPLYAGHLSLATNKNVLDTIQQSDCVIVLGSRLSEVTTQDYSIIKSTQKLIHVDIANDVIGKIFQPELGIVADLKEALIQLNTINVMPTWKEWALERCKAYQESSGLKILANDVINKHVIDILMNTLPKESIITNDAGNFAGWLHSFYKFNSKKTYIGPTSGAMGYGLPAAIGAKIARPNQVVVSLSGDGGFMMTVQELETAVRCRVPVIALVFNNQMYGTIRMHQEIHFPKRVIGTDLGEVSFKDLALSMGAKGYRVTTKEEFENSLQEALKENQLPSVIEIMTDPNQISVNKTIEQLRI